MRSSASLKSSRPFFLFELGAHLFAEFLEFFLLLRGQFLFHFCVHLPDDAESVQHSIAPDAADVIARAHEDGHQLLLLFRRQLEPVLVEPEGHHGPVGVVAGDALLDDSKGEHGTRHDADDEQAGQSYRNLPMTQNTHGWRTVSMTLSVMVTSSWLSSASEE